MQINPNRLNFTEEDFDRIVKDLKALLFERGEQYNVKSLVHDYFPLKPESYNTMIYIKCLREMNKQNQKEFDSLKDLIIYAMFKLDYYAKTEK